MPLEKQLSVFVKNQVGSLSGLCEALSRENINIRGVTTLEDVEWGIIGLIVDDFDKAKATLERLNYKFGESMVLTLELENKPGALAEVSRKLAEQNINVVHAYATAAGDRSMIVLLTTDNKRAEQILQT